MSTRFSRGARSAFTPAGFRAGRGFFFESREVLVGHDEKIFVARQQVIQPEIR